jgi:hypothetical protein
MSTPEQRGFAAILYILGKYPRSDPGAKPADTGKVNANVFSHNFSDWVKADMDFKENGLRPKFS